MAGGQSAQATKVARYEAAPGEVTRCVLLFSGGLDSSVMIPYLKENYGCEVVAFTADLGDPQFDQDQLLAKAKKLGAIEAYAPDLRDVFADEFLAKAILANAEYGGPGGGYFLGCPMGRVLIAREAVKLARKVGAQAIAHGCTGKGNDQVRFDSYITTLDPALKVIAPVREWNMGRDEEMAYAAKHGIDVPPPRSDAGAAYSNDDNIWGYTAEGGDIEFPDRQPPMDEILRLCTPPQQAPDQPATVRIAFERGHVRTVDGQAGSTAELITRLNALGGAHGVGFQILIEDRIVGLKVRGVYENPAAHLIVHAHRALERLTTTRTMMDTKAPLERQWSNLLYDGRWYEPTMDALAAFFEAANETVTGTATLQLYRGHARVTAVESKYALFDSNLATFDSLAEGLDGFNTAASAPFIELYSQGMRQSHAVRTRVV